MPNETAIGGNTVVSTKRKKVVVFREIPEDLLSIIQAQHDVIVTDPRQTHGRERFLLEIRDANGLLGSSVKMGRSELEGALQLEVISSISVGVDNYDLPELRARRITLCHTPGVLTETTADTIFGLILCTMRRMPELSQYVRDGSWTRNIGEDLFGWDVHGKTLGILGFGRIGQAVARRAALGFGMQVVFHNTSTIAVSPAMGDLRQAAFEEVIGTADIVVSTVPLTEQTRGLMNANAFSAMKPGAVFINGSRGAIVQESALLHALNHGNLRAAGLDVFETEPLPLDSPLRTHPKVTPFPHIGSATHETRRAMAEMATDNLLLVLAGKAPLAKYNLNA